MLEYESFINPIADIIDNNFDCYPNETKNILIQWAENKEKLYKLFDNQLIITGKTIEINIQDEDLMADEFLRFKCKIFTFLDEEIRVSLFKEFLHDAVGISGFVQNKVLNSWTGYIDKTFTITPGMKFARAFKFFFKEEEKEKLIAFQNFYSTFTQQFKSKRKGKICLSIHPYDYLTSSINNNNWSTCHSLKEGDYRAGNFNYMVDNSTIVAYYIAEDDYNDKILYDLQQFKWNSKYWRMFIHVNSDENKCAICYNKQYPGDSNQLLQEVNVLLLPIYEKLYTLKESFVLLEAFSELGIKPFYYPEYSCSHNDIHEGNDIKFKVSVGHDLEDFKKFISIGEQFNCLSCGSYPALEGNSGYCISCNHKKYGKECDICRNFHDIDDIYWVESTDMQICNYCYEKYYNICQICKKEYTYEAYEDLTPYRGKLICSNCEEKIQLAELKISEKDIDSSLLIV